MKKEYRKNVSMTVVLLENKFQIILFKVVKYFENDGSLVHSHSTS